MNHKLNCKVQSLILQVWTKMCMHHVVAVSGWKWNTFSFNVNVPMLLVTIMLVILIHRVRKSRSH